MTTGKISFQGALGANSDMACRQVRPDLQPLPCYDFEETIAAVHDEAPSAEARLATALVSSFPPTRPFVLYRFGVEARNGRFEHTKRSPPRWVWGPGALATVLTRVVMRRTLDWEADRKKGEENDAGVRLAVPSESTWIHAGEDAVEAASGGA